MQVRLESLTYESLTYGQRENSVRETPILRVWKLARKQAGKIKL
jgi:hypothetical protein